MNTYTIAEFKRDTEDIKSDLNLNNLINLVSSKLSLDGTMFKISLEYVSEVECIITLVLHEEEGIISVGIECYSKSNSINVVKTLTKYKHEGKVHTVYRIPTIVVKDVLRTCQLCEEQ